jgi:hypothetical protein
MTLIDEIRAKCPPELLNARNAQAITDAVNVGRTRVDEVTKFASLGISERFPSLNGLPGPLGAELLFRKLEAFAPVALQSPDIGVSLLGGAVIRQMGHLKGAGMAIGSPAVRQMLAALVGAGAITQVEADALVSVASLPDPITEFEVRRACWADNGDWLP